MIACALLILLAAFPLAAQQAPAPSGKLAFLVQDLLSSTTAGIPDPSLRKLIGDTIQPRFASINTGVASALSNLPVPSPASAIGYRPNPVVGADVPFRKSLGPILTERFETIGKNKFFFAATFQRFQFDRLDQVDFRNFTVGIPLRVSMSGITADGLISAATTISLNMTQATGYFTYGLTRDLDLTVSMPVVTSSMTVSTRALVQNPLLGSPLPFPRTGIGASSTGFGDILVRTKKRLSGTKNGGVALVADFRIPTGDEFNYHGAGAYGVKPFLAASLSKWRVAPHINAGYQFNGKSYLATLLADAKAWLPGEAFWAVGADVSTTRNPLNREKHVTFSADLLDRIVINGKRSLLVPQTAADGTSYSAFQFDTHTRHELNAAFGFKAELRTGLVLTCNLLLRLNSSGLRSRAVPLTGMSYIYQ